MINYIPLKFITAEILDKLANYLVNCPSSLYGFFKYFNNTNVTVDNIVKLFNIISKEPDKIYVPHGLKATDFTQYVWPLRTFEFNVDKSQTIIISRKN